MAEIVQSPVVQLFVTIRLTEQEARAMDALVGYGDDAFITVFYEKLGKHYMEPYEGGLRSLFKSMRQTLPGIISRTDAARRKFNGE